MEEGDRREQGEATIVSGGTEDVVFLRLLLAWFFFFPLLDGIPAIANDVRSICCVPAQKLLQ